jgi:hypothetical protein
MSDQSDNEVFVRTGGKIAIGSEFWDIRDGGHPVMFTDVITEARHGNGVVSLSFGAGVIDANGKPFVDITHRMRMSLASAQFLRNLLDGMIKEALTPVDKSQAN